MRSNLMRTWTVVGSPWGCSHHRRSSVGAPVGVRVGRAGAVLGRAMLRARPLIWPYRIAPSAAWGVMFRASSEWNRSGLRVTPPAAFIQALPSCPPPAEGK